MIRYTFRIFMHFNTVSYILFSQKQQFRKQIMPKQISDSELLDLIDSTNGVFM